MVFPIHSITLPLELLRTAYSSVRPPLRFLQEISTYHSQEISDIAEFFAAPAMSDIFLFL